MNRATAIIVFFLTCSSVYADEPFATAPDKSPPIPHKLVLPTDEKGNVSLTSEQINYIVSILNAQRAAIVDVTEMMSDLSNKYHELVMCVKTAQDRDRQIELKRCINGDVPTWQVEAQK